MIFSSTPETNDDPEPWVCTAPDFERYADKDDYEGIHGVIFDPDPQFDRTHKPNPILVEFRESIVEGNWPEGVRLAADYWLNALEFDPLDGTDDERWHAMRVLTRLARLA